MKCREKYEFRNWGRNVSVQASQYCQPENEQELIYIIKKQKKIRVVGASHSWSDVCKTSDALINLDLYNKLIEIDKVNKVVKVQAGIRFYELIQVLEKNGLALINLGSIDQQSLAGAASTGTHGTGLNFKILGSHIIELSIIKADGEKLIVNKHKQEDLYRACIVNIGMLGVISEIKLQVTKAFNLHERTGTVPFAEAIENIHTYIEENDHVKLWWLPPAENIVLYRYERTQDAVNDSRIRQFMRDKFFSVYLYRSLVFISRKFPALSGNINRLLIEDMKKPLDRIEKSQKVFLTPEPPHHRETEWAFDVKDAREILSDYRDFLTRKAFKLNFIQEIRFTQADEFWLSPAYKRDTMWLGFYAYKHENWEETLPEFEKFAREHGGRPHWGKEFAVGKAYLRKQYEKYDDFKQLKRTLDPEGKFSNDYIKRLFGEE